MAKFKRRTEAPTRDNYWYSSTDSPYNNGEDGIFDCGGNCTAYGYSRSAELAGEWLDLPLANAKEWWDINRLRGTFPYGYTPKLGAIGVFTGTLINPYTGDTYGHILIVEQVDDNGFGSTESAYSTNPDECILWHEDYYEFDEDGEIIDSHGHGQLIGFIYPRDYEEETMTREEKEIYTGECYAEYLGRPVDEVGLETYCALIPDDASWEDDLSELVDNNIKKSDEYKNRYKRIAITNFYNILLGRDPDEIGMKTYMSYGRLRDIYRDIYNSEEARNKRGE